MTRTVSTTTQNATAEDVTQPIYLIRMAWDTERRAATWAVDVPWDSEIWSASGAECDGVDANGGVLILPIGEDDPWLNLVQTEVPRGREITVYEHQTDRTVSPETSDAVEIFSGVMDETVMTHRGIRISLIEGQTNKVFPPSAINPPIYNWLPSVGTRLIWGHDSVTVT